MEENQYTQALDALEQHYANADDWDDWDDDECLSSADDVATDLNDDLDSAATVDSIDIVDNADQATGRAAIPNHDNLAMTPMQEWGGKRVSNVSYFRDTRWIFTSMGSVIYQDTGRSTWDDSGQEGACGLLLPENWLRLTLIKSLVFYRLPQNAVFGSVRSYSSVPPSVPIAKWLARLFARYDLYIDPHGTGQYRTINNLNRGHVEQFLMEDLPSPQIRYAVARLIRDWRHLSITGYLPADIHLAFEAIDDTTFKRLWEEMRQARRPYLPLSLDTFAALVSGSATWVETYANPIITAYNILLPVLAKAAADPIAIETFSWDQALIDLRALQDRYPRVQELGWNDDIYVVNRKKKGNARGSQRSTLLDFFTTLVVRLRTACAVLVLATNGARRSEVRCLQAKHAWKAGDQYLLRRTVYKRSDASQGEEVDLPIPEITFKAMKCLDKLTKPARRYGKTTYLLVGLVSRRPGLGALLTSTGFRTALDDYVTALGIDEHIHPHQFRKTLAMFLIYQDTRHLHLIQRLFSHRSLEMTLLYISQIPGIDEEIKEMLVRENRTLLAELLESVDMGMLGGKAGLRIKEAQEAVTDRSKHLFPGTLRDDRREALDMYVEELLQQGIVLLHRTPLGVICIKTPGVSQPAPCDPPNASPMDLLQPSIHNCDPFDCTWAAFVKNSIPRLRNEIAGLEARLGRADCSDDERAFSRKRIAKCRARLVELGETGGCSQKATDRTETRDRVEHTVITRQQQDQIQEEDVNAQPSPM